MTARRSGLPLGATAFIWMVALGGAAAAGTMLSRVPQWTARDAAAWAGLAAAVALSEQFWIELRHRTERETSRSPTRSSSRRCCSSGPVSQCLRWGRARSPDRRGAASRR